MTRQIKSKTKLKLIIRIYFLKNVPQRLFDNTLIPRRLKKLNGFYEQKRKQKF